MARGRDAVTKPAVSNTSGAKRDAVSSGIANSAGVEHLHISSDQPEAEELRSFVEGMRGVNVDHARRSPAIFNPVTSKAQFRAMQAAKHGESNIGIPQSVGEDFAPSGVKMPKGLPNKKRK
jgi:hypothetical protein